MGMTITEIVMLRQLYAQAQLTELRGDGEVEIRWIAIPEEYTPPVGTGEYFDETSMRGLSAEGQRLGADPGSWTATSP